MRMDFDNSVAEFGRDNSVAGDKSWSAESWTACEKNSTVEYSYEEYLPTGTENGVKETDVDCFFMKNRKTGQKCALQGRLLSGILREEILLLRNF